MSGRTLGGKRWKPSASTPGTWKSGSGGRLRVKCTGCVKDEAGRVTEILCTYDPDSRGGDPADGRKVKSTIHWVDAENCFPTQRSACTAISSTTSDPDAAGADFSGLPESPLEIRQGCKVEASLASAQPASRFQFMRQGYFCADSKDSQPDHLVFNRKVSLKDSCQAGEGGSSLPARPGPGGQSNKQQTQRLPPKSAGGFVYKLPLKTHFLAVPQNSLVFSHRAGL